MVLVKILFFANENRIGFCELTIRQSLLHHPPANPIAVLRKGGGGWRTVLWYFVKLFTMKEHPVRIG
jgi:hypothetical protein